MNFLAGILTPRKNARKTRTFHASINLHRRYNAAHHIISTPLFSTQLQWQRWRKLSCWAYTIYMHSAIHRAGCTFVQFNLVCGREILYDISSSAYFVGVLISSLVTGYVLDRFVILLHLNLCPIAYRRLCFHTIESIGLSILCNTRWCLLYLRNINCRFGRRIPTILYCFGMMISMLLTAYSPSVMVFSLVRLLVAFFTFGCHLGAYCNGMIIMFNAQHIFE